MLLFLLAQTFESFFEIQSHPPDPKEHSIGVTGVNWNVQIIALKFLNNSG